MAIETGSGVPEILEAGSTYIFQEGPFADFPVGTWDCDLVIQISGQPPITSRAAVSGTYFLFTLNSTDTAAIPPGRYTFALYASTSTQRAKARTGVLQVLQDLSQEAEESDAQLMLAAISDAIKKLAKNQFSSVSVNGVSYTRADLATLISQRTRLQAEVIREQQAQDAFRGIETSGRISTRFAGGGEGQPFWGKCIGDR